MWRNDALWSNSAECRPWDDLWSGQSPGRATPLDWPCSRWLGRMGWANASMPVYVIRSSIEAGARPGVANARGHTAVKFAATKLNLGAKRELPTFGPDVNTTDRADDTLLDARSLSTLRDVCRTSPILIQTPGAGDTDAQRTSVYRLAAPLAIALMPRIHSPIRLSGTLSRPTCRM